MYKMMQVSDLRVESQLSFSGNNKCDELRLSVSASNKCYTELKLSYQAVCSI